MQKKFKNPISLKTKYMTFIDALVFLGGVRSDEDDGAIESEFVKRLIGDFLSHILFLVKPVRWWHLLRIIK